MSSVGTFLLALAAFLGTVMFFVNPFIRLRKYIQGKKQIQVVEELKTAWLNDPVNLVLQGFGCCIFSILSIVYIFVIEPLAVITAIVNKIGFQPIAYLILLIVAYKWWGYVRSYKNGKPTASVTVKTEEVETVTGETAGPDEEVNFGNPAWNNIKRIFYFLPVLYLWYLLLVVLGFA